MCSPTAIGVASFGANAASSIGSFAGQSAQTAASNQAMLNEHVRQQSLQMADTYQRYSAYNTSKADYQRQLTANTEAAYDAYNSEQARLNAIYAKAAFSKQENLTNQAQMKGAISATGQAGTSVRRAQTMVDAAFGRNDAITANSLTSARNAMKISVDKTFRELNNTNQVAYSNIYQTPSQPVPLAQPVFTPSPSPLLLAGGLASAAIGGVQTGFTAKRQGWFS